MLSNNVQIETYKIKHQAINNQFFKTLNVVAIDLFEVELVKTIIEHREPNNVKFFILQYAKLRIFELYYNSFDQFCDINKFEEIEMDTDSFNLVLAEKLLY